MPNSFIFLTHFIWSIHIRVFTIWARLLLFTTNSLCDDTFASQNIYIFTCASRFRFTSRCAVCHISLLVVFCVCFLSKEKKHTIRWHWIPMCTAKLTTTAQCETEKSMWLWESAKTYREHSAEYFPRWLKVFVQVEFGILSSDSPKNVHFCTGSISETRGGHPKILKFPMFHIDSYYGSWYMLRKIKENNTRQIRPLFHIEQWMSWLERIILFIWLKSVWIQLIQFK